MPPVLARRLLLAFFLVFGIGLQPALGQDGVDSQTVSDDSLLTLYDGLRVADVSDGMDVVGLRDVGLLDPSIRTLWRDIENMEHRFQGIAVTARYVPTNDPAPDSMSFEEFQKWSGEWYNEISPEPFLKYIEEGTAMVIDASGDGDTGSIGSYNALNWVSEGMNGIVTTGSVRDTDEIVKEDIPVYFNPLERGRGIRPGRNEIESVQEPVEIGGVLVEPGDVVVADGDGVVVVPRNYAVPVAKIARKIMQSDKQARRQLYKELDRPLDETVKQ